MVGGMGEFLLPPGEKARMRDDAARVAAKLAHGEEVSLRCVEDASHRFLRSKIERRRVQVMRVTGGTVGHVVWLDGAEKPRPAWHGREPAGAAARSELGRTGFGGLLNFMACSSPDWS